MFNVRLAGGHLFGKQLFTWLSLVVSLMASFVLSFFPLDVLDEIWDLIESVSEGFLTYSFILPVTLCSLFSIAVRPYCKNIRRFYGKIPGIWLPVLLPLFLQAFTRRTFLEIKIC